MPPNPPIYQPPGGSVPGNIEVVPQDAIAPSTIMKVYTPFYNDDVVKNLSRRVTTGMWTGNTGSLETFFTSSTQSGSTGDWYYDVYNLDPNTDSTAEIQFSVAYGHRLGGGYPLISVSASSKEPTKANYAQYRNLLLDPEDEQFTFGGSVNSDDIYVINIRRARLKQKMDAGNWELTLTNGSETIKLIDDSGDQFDQLTSQGGRLFNVVSGSLSGGTITAASLEPSGGLGLFYPDRGLIVFNPAAIQEYIGLIAGTGSKVADNHGAFFDTIVNASSFTSRNEEIVTSTHYFVRVKNKDYNFSNNSTFYTSSDGSLTIPTFINDPQVYITTVGLYNSLNELLAVAKISVPVLKSFDREALIKCKIDF